MATIISKKSNYLWWALCLLGFYIVIFVSFFASSGNLTDGIGQGVLLSVVASSLNVSVGLSWIVQIGTALLSALILTFPLLLFRIRKSALGIVALLFIAELVFIFMKAPKSGEGALYLLLFPGVIGSYIAVYLFLVGLPALIQKKVNLDTTIRSLVAVTVVILALVFALFLTAFAIYASLLATQLPVSQTDQLTASEQKACERMELVSQYANPWRGYFRYRCPLGIGEQLLFPTISDEQLRQYAVSCNIQRLFSNRSSSLSGLCLQDRSGFLTTSRDILYQEVHYNYHPERSVDCSYLSKLDLQVFDSEEEIFSEMQRQCVPPATN